MPQTPWVFVSATTRDLGSFRRAAAAALEKRDVHAIVQENFPPDYREVIELLRERIAQCDAVICLVGFYYGAEPQEPPDGALRRSYTQLEYDIAVALDKPVFKLLADEGCPFDPHRPEPDEVRAAEDPHGVLHRLRTPVLQNEPANAVQVRCEMDVLVFGIDG